jgi:hypothetical protein
MEDLLIVPEQYKVSYSDEFLSSFKDDLEYFRKLLPEFNHWKDSEVVEFANDYASLHFFCAMQPPIINREMLDMAIAINGTNQKMEELGEVDFWDEELKNLIDKLKSKTR